MAGNSQTPKTMIAIRLPVDTVESLRKVATENERSLSAEIRLAARRHLEHEAKES